MKKTAPQEQGAARVSLNALWNQRGIPPSIIAKWLNVEESTVLAWENGTEVPNTHECRWLAVILDCKVKEIYRAILWS